MRCKPECKIRVLPRDETELSLRVRWAKLRHSTIVILSVRWADWRTNTHESSSFTGVIPRGATTRESAVAFGQLPGAPSFGQQSKPMVEFADALYSYLAPVQSRITFAACPEVIAAKPCSNSWYGKRCVMTGEISSPDSSMTDILYQVSYISRP